MAGRRGPLSVWIGSGLEARAVALPEAVTTGTLEGGGGTRVAFTALIVAGVSEGRVTVALAVTVESAADD
ncbi:hypothetical protein [Streptomyces hokutonensis]|uniref:hypothetical protein n=1 Tax=Streptomyces hokutonensis TaxID=1306990 RepID=UPI000476C383|nr:hypothetical protein [Streptomyces hokutonensis]